MSLVGGISVDRCISAWATGIAPIISWPTLTCQVYEDAKRWSAQFLFCDYRSKEDSMFQLCIMSPFDRLCTDIGVEMA